MNQSADSLKLAKIIGSISLFALLFSAFGVATSNLSYSSITQFIIIVAVVVIMAGLTGRVWDIIFGGFD